MISINPPFSEWPEITKRPALNIKLLEEPVTVIMDEVRRHGDLAVKKFTRQFDSIEIDELSVLPAEFAEADSLVETSLKEAIQQAKVNIEKFHATQQQDPVRIETMTDVVCWRKNVAIQKVGLYIPGGTAPLFSTLLMLGVPAILAGCKEIIVCTPPAKDGKINPVILYTANLLGIRKIFKAGGAQAIAAMTFGTESMPAVYKIFGPGNQFVTCAKQLAVAHSVAIDMPAGPSEVAVYADHTCTAAFVAADLLSQAEHGKDSQVLLISDSLSVAENIKNEIAVQLAQLSRRSIAEAALENSRFIVMENIDEAFSLLNDYAPEHLIIASDDALTLMEKVVNAGSVFLGHYSSESIGDYASGTNHTLPTGGYARAYSGVSLDSFVKKITYQLVGSKGIQVIGPIVEEMAMAEGLQAHSNAVSIRLKSLN